MQTCNFCGRELSDGGPDCNGSEVWFVGSVKKVKCWDCVKERRYAEVQEG